MALLPWQISGCQYLRSDHTNSDGMLADTAMALLPWQIRQPLGLPNLRSNSTINDGMDVMQGSGPLAGEAVQMYHCMQPLLHAVHMHGREVSAV